jgi:DNA primase
VRRWAGRLLRLGTLLATKLWQAIGWSASIAPTILAWDWTAIRRILLLEASEQSVSRKELDELKQQIPLRDYLEALAWRPMRRLSRGRWMGLCPLHDDHQPSFLMDPSRNLFYCYGCGRGGDVIRFAELYHQVQFPQALALLRQWRGLEPLLQETAGFYRMQLHRHGEAVAYLHHRGLCAPELIEHMRIGYAPGGCLRGWLTRLGYPLPALRQAGLVSTVGFDTYIHRIVFPLEGNLYGRSLSTSAPPHRFLPGTKQILSVP